MSENPTTDTGRMTRLRSGPIWTALYRLAVLGLLGVVAWHTSRVADRVEASVYVRGEAVPVDVRRSVDVNWPSAGVPVNVQWPVDANVVGTVQVQGLVDANVVGMSIRRGLPVYVVGIDGPVDAYVSGPAVPVKVQGTVDAYVSGPVDANVVGFDWAGPLQHQASPVRVR